MEPPKSVSTPPHHPIYNIYVTTAQIELILKHAIPSATLVSSEPFPHGSSYNNRLYDLTITAPQRSSSDSTTLSYPSTQHLILKLTGRFWKRTKTLNEVACLQLLSQFPSLHIPRLIAWSADASSMENVPHEWILMTKMPGSPLPEVGLDEADAKSVARDLAEFLRTLRTIPSPGKLGNLVRIDSNGVPEIGSLVDVPNAKDWPYDSYLKYQTAVYEAAIANLEHEPIYARNRQPHNDLPLQLRDFVDETLPSYPVFRSVSSDEEPISVMTHGDLSLRNILAHRSTPNSPFRVTAVLDWEFSGFFLPYEEFLTADSEILDFSKDGKSDSLSSHLLTELMARDLSTPRNGRLEEHWELARRIHLVRENIAPWWVRELDLDNTELSTELAKAGMTIRTLLNIGHY